jgi:thiamine pyrophosphate-dependent acetolactate synthase large subunit-like protein
LKVSQKIALDDKSEVEVDFTPEDNKKYTDLMGLYLLHNDLKPSAENAQKARDYAVGEIIRERFTDIVKGLLEKDRKTQWEAFQKTRNNNRPLATTQFSDNERLSREQQILQTLETGEPHVPNN